MAEQPNNNPRQGHGSFQNPADSDEIVNFAVMPHANDNYAESSKMPQQRMNDITPPEHHSIWHSKATYGVVSVLIVITLGALAHFLLWSDGGTPEKAESKLPEVFLQKYFGAATCADDARCGDSADPDQDGLSNYDEFREQTNPSTPDTDEDGLADSDEILIYRTDPTDKYTDPRDIAEENNFLDSLQVKNGYDPLTPGLKMSEARLEQIQTDTAKFGLHEPTITSLANAAPQPKTVTVTIAGGKFDQTSVTINTNDTVTWLNKDIAPHQIASDPHPDHSALPDLESGSLATNQTFSYKFTKAGTFAYHDHLNPTVKATIIVK